MDIAAVWQTEAGQRELVLLGTGVEVRRAHPPTVMHPSGAALCRYAAQAVVPLNIPSQPLPPSPEAVPPHTLRRVTGRLRASFLSTVCEGTAV